MSERVGRVVVGVSGSLANLAALRAAAQRARATDAPLVAVLAWAPVGGEFNYRRQPCREMLDLWRRAAADRLAAAFDQCFGGVPTDLATELAVLRGAAGPALLAVADRPQDTLYLGTGRDGLTRRLRVRVMPYCCRHAVCPVIGVAPPDLALQVRGAHAQPACDRPLHFRHRYS